MLRFAHFNFNVFNLERSLEFYRKALNLHVVRETKKEAFTIVYLMEDTTGFELELTWLKDRTEPYDLGEKEFHLALVTDEYERMHALHRDLGCICFENPAMGIYFIEDPDGYWIEIVPAKKHPIKERTA